MGATMVTAIHDEGADPESPRHRAASTLEGTTLIWDARSPVLPVTTGFPDREHCAPAQGSGSPVSSSVFRLDMNAGQPCWTDLRTLLSGPMKSS